MWQKLSVFTIFVLVVGLGGNFISASGQRGGVTPGDITPAAALTSAQEPQPFFVALNTFGNIHAFDISAQAGLSRYQVNIPQAGETPLILVEAAVGDFTGDRICDVMAFDNNKNLYRFVAGSDRRFTRQLVLQNALPATNFHLTSKIGDTTVADFNGDGRLDFAVSGAHCENPPCLGVGEDELGDGLVQIFLNQGNGSFTSTSSVDFPQFDSRQYERIAGLGAGDFNKNGRMDLFIQHYWNAIDNPAYVALNNGNGSFGLPTQLFTNPHPGGTNALVVGDFDKDGILDLVVGQDNDEPAGRTWFYKGLPGGTFENRGIAYDTSLDLAEGTGQGLADAYDFNRDGNLDIVAAAEGLGIYLFLGNGDGTFQERLALYDADGAWFKISTPPLGSEYACFWNEEAATPHLYLPFLSQ
jgi:hypothetical protein